MPSNPELFNRDNSGESAGETSRTAERGKIVLEAFIVSKRSSREILDFINDGGFDAVENETAEQKAARLEKAREARAKLVEERERLYGKRDGEASAAEVSAAEAPVEAPAEAQVESPAEAPTEIEEAVAAQEEAPTSVSAEEIATATAGTAIETAATEEAEKLATAEKEELAGAELEAKLDEVAAFVAAADAKRKAQEESKTRKTQTPETTEATVEQVASKTEVISEAEARATLNKAKENPTLRNRALSLFLALATIAAIIPASVAGIIHDANHDSNPQETPITQVEKANTGETQEAEIGIKDGYGEKGMFLSENKGTPNDFASAAEVAEVCTTDNKIDETEMVIYTADNQVESMADYMANLPEELQPEGFKGLTILETEQKLQSLSDEEYEKVQQEFNDIMDEAFVRDITLDGDYQNAYMQLIDPSKPATHDNMELVACTTHEQGITVKEFVWYQDNNANNPVIGSMIVKIIQNEDGTISGCIQVVNKVGSPVYDGMPPVTPDQPDSPGDDEPTGNEPTGDEPTGDEPTGNEPTGNEPTGDEPTGNEPTGDEPTGDEPTGDEGSGWGKEGDPHSGDLVDYSDLVDPGSEVTQEQNDATNQGNQGYVDDNHAQPGSASENNGVNQDGFSQIIADGADTEGGRLSGGEQQGGDGMNGTNANAPSAEQIASDNAGNEAQRTQVEAGNTAGGNNNSDTAEESRVAEGNF